KLRSTIRGKSCWIGRHLIDRFRRRALECRAEAETESDPARRLEREEPRYLTSGWQHARSATSQPSDLLDNSKSMVWIWHIGDLRRRQSDGCLRGPSGRVAATHRG